MHTVQLPAIAGNPLRLAPASALFSSPDSMLLARDCVMSDSVSVATPAEFNACSGVCCGVTFKRWHAESDAKYLDTSTFDHPKAFLSDL
ncbi:hypothetical protein ROSI111154_13045 [Rouxiella silvae]